MAENLKEESSNKKIKHATLWNYVQAICTVLFVFFILLKFYDSTFTVDFSTLLSIVLAIFSIWLSATFYFKATETSNRFYENTYTHSKDIATLLVKIESGFGEKLDSLRDNYSSIDSRMNGYIKNPIEKEREDIESEMSEATEEVEKLKSSKSEIIDSLILKADLAEKDKEKIKLQLQEKEINLKKSNEKIASLENKLSRLDRKINRGLNSFEYKSQRVERYLRNQVKNQFMSKLCEDDISKFNIETINKVLSDLIENREIPSVFVREAIECGYIDINNALTVKGITVLNAE